MLQGSTACPPRRPAAAARRRAWVLRRMSVMTDDEDVRCDATSERASTEKNRVDPDYGKAPATSPPAVPKVYRRRGAQRFLKFVEHGPVIDGGSILGDRKFGK